MYLLHPGLDQTEAVILQYLHCSGIIKSIHSEVMICDVCQRTNRSIKKYGNLPANTAEETPWNKLCVDIIRPCKIPLKGKEPLILK